MTDKLENFLNILLYQHKNGELSPELESSLRELMNLTAETKSLSVIKSVTPELFENNSFNKEDVKENMKYYTLGWYIYNILNVDKKNDEKEKDNEIKQ
jgi:hypothetical protein